MKYQVELSIVGACGGYSKIPAKHAPAVGNSVLNSPINNLGSGSETCCNTFRTFIGPWDVLFECHYDNASESLDFVERFLERYGPVIAKVETLSVLAHTKGSDCTVK